MYELRPESIKTFVEDSSITLPRFQRKLTWNEKKNFNLCISIFKDYPIGVVVLTRDNTEGNEKYLLDGRQRRNALSQMRNPENIYLWGKSAIGFSVYDSAEDVQEAYWEYVDDYLGREEYESEDIEEEVFGDDEDTNGEVEADEATPETDDEIDGEDDEDNIDSEDEVSIELAEGLVEDEDTVLREDPGLINLLNLLLTVHPLRRPASGLTRPFDFRDAVEDLEYINVRENGDRYVDTDELLAWIRYRKQRAEISEREFPPTKEDFYDWLTTGTDLEWTSNHLEEEIDRRWEKIQKILSLLDVLEQKLQDSTIGYLLIRDATANDEKKIFEIINTAGTSLTAVEILSAKPSWNQPIESAHPDILSNKEELYSERMEIPAEGVVRWDHAATLLDRLDIDYIIDQSSVNFETSMTIGFKILSGYYSGGISKDDVEALGRVDEVPWGTCNFENKLNEMTRLIEDATTIQFWSDWENSLENLTSVAVALNYLLCMIEYWDHRGNPSTTNSSALSQFQQKGVICLDRMIYEYITGQWRGSSDSRIASNLSDIGSGNAVFEPVSSDRWAQLMTEVLEDGRIEGRSYLEKKSVDKRVKLLLRYYYVLSHEGAPRGPDVQIDVDHIIPTAAFEASSRNDLERYRNHMANLALLPSKPNINKGDQFLNELSDNWLISEVERYTGIDRSDFGSFSTVMDIEDLIEMRSGEIMTTFTDTRREILELS